MLTENKRPQRRKQRVFKVTDDRFTVSPLGLSSLSLSRRAGGRRVNPGSSAFQLFSRLANFEAQNIFFFFPPSLPPLRFPACCIQSWVSLQDAADYKVCFPLYPTFTLIFSSSTSPPSKDSHWVYAGVCNIRLLQHLKFNLRSHCSNINQIKETGNFIPQLQ